MNSPSTQVRRSGRVFLMSAVAITGLGIASVGAASVANDPEDELDTIFEQAGQTTTATAPAGGSPTTPAGDDDDDDDDDDNGASPTARGPQTGTGLVSDDGSISPAALAAVAGGALAVLGGGAYVATRRRDQ